MAYTLLDGTAAAIDIQTALTGTTADKSMKCIASTVTFTFRRPTTAKTTFCTTGWTGATPGNKTMFAVVGGFMSTGDVLADPLAMFSVQAALPFILTADTGNTIQGNWVETEDANTLVAANNSGRSMAFESDGPVTSTWVVA